MEEGECECRQGRVAEEADFKFFKSSIVDGKDETAVTVLGIASYCSYRSVIV